MGNEAELPLGSCSLQLTRARIRGSLLDATSTLPLIHFRYVHVATLA
jgi:hypothetical protein